MIKTTHIHSLTDFTRNAKSYIQQIKETQSPIVLTVNGSAEVIVQDAASYQLMVDELERLRLPVTAHRGKEGGQGFGTDVDKAVTALRAKFGL